MAKKKRWGKKFVDKRNWKEYNRKLVQRGVFYINPLFLDTWLKEIEQMNKGKIGQPYLYPDSMIEFSGVLYARGFDYRSIEGIIEALSNKLGNFPIISFSQIRRRIKNLPLLFKKKGSKLCVGCDGSGIKVSNRGEWIRQKWKIRRGWIKVTIIGTTKGDIVDIRIGNENLNENSASRGMLRNNHKDIDKMMGDGLYDVYDNFKLLNRLGIEPVIKIRKDAITKAKGCMARKKEVLQYKKLEYKNWAKQKKYGYRWVATEGIFSAVKRMMGECVRSHKKREMYKEARLKFWAYQKVRDSS